MLGDHAVVLASEDARRTIIPEGCHLVQASTASLEAEDTCLCPSPKFNSSLFLYTTAASATRTFE